MRYRILAVALAACIANPVAAAGAQGIGARIKQRIKDKADSTTDTLAIAAVNKAAAVIKCVVTDKRCIKKANDAGKPVVVTDKAGTPLPNQEQAAKDAGVKTPAPAPATAAATPVAPTTAGAGVVPTTADVAVAPPGQGVWLNYDFVPGDRTLFAEDFSGNDVGDFPRRLHLTEGNMEVVKVGGQTMLRGPDGGKFYLVLPERLPPRFTVEIDRKSVV